MATALSDCLAVCPLTVWKHTTDQAVAETKMAKSSRSVLGIPVQWSR